ncbi:MAG: hypothetical protein J6Q34_08170 [Bacteroidales bacterium]|nr:hypothetical protein [Bacteroidales bacterium]
MQEVVDSDIYTSMETLGATRTSLDENYNVLWSAGDQIVAFMKTAHGSRYEIKGQYVGTTTGAFSKVAEGGSDDLEQGQEIGHNVVYYPYSSGVLCSEGDDNMASESYQLRVVLPQVQHFAENSFGDGVFPMVAVSSDNHLIFRNICGGIKLRFKGTGTIMSIRLEGVGEEPISGDATVSCYVDGGAPEVRIVEGASKSVVLDCGDGIRLSEDEPATFIIAVPPVEFLQGIRITVTDADNNGKTFTNSSANRVKRSSLLSFPVITFNSEDVEKDYWAGKKMVWNGNSISYGSWLSSPAKDAYPYLVGDALGMDVYNFAIGGSYAAKPKGAFETYYWDYDKWLEDVSAGVVDKTKKYLVKDYVNAAKPCRIYYYDGKSWKANSETGGWAIVERMKEMVALHPDADLIGIAVGTNDFYTAACPFGSVGGVSSKRLEELKQKYESYESANLIGLGKLHSGMKLLAGEYSLAIGAGYTVCHDIPVVPGYEYRVKGGYRSWFLDADKKALSTVNLKDQSFRFVAPKDACYISITFSGSISDAYVYISIPEDETDLTHSTFCGAVHTICRYLQDNYKNKDIVFVTPIERYQNWCNYQGAKNSLGYTLKDYSDAIIEICSYYSIPVIDFYKNSGLNPHVDKSKFGDTDGKAVHPNEEGHRIMASVAVEFLQAWK